MRQDESVSAASVRVSMVTASVAARGCNRGGRGGGDTPDFKWQGWSNGAKNQNPKKALDRNLTLKNSHAEFPSHKISVTDKRIQQFTPEDILQTIRIDRYINKDAT